MGELAEFCMGGLVEVWLIGPAKRLQKVFFTGFWGVERASTE
jgi:hypothetical protein